MRVLAIIPARGGSRRLPGKNIRVLGGKPLIVWSVEAALASPAICDVLVSTDDPEIAEVASAAHALVPWLRPAELATDTAKSTDVALHALDWYETERGEVDGLLLLQPTSPFRSPSTISRGLDEFIANGRKPVVGVSRTAAHPMWTYTIANGWLLPFMAEHEPEVRSQDLPECFVVNGAFYLISPSELRETKSIFGVSAKPLVIDSELEALDIDTEFDWRIAECLLGILVRDRVTA
jgi:CMP-N,N'-diacetyllegionaminic acid synthase